MPSDDDGLRGVAAREQSRATSLARLFELASRSLHSAGYAEDLFPAQWTTLRYIASAPELARTATDLARFQQIAIGPVTRTIRTLIAKGLLQKAGKGTHHRSELLALTPAGISLIQKDPLRQIDAVFLTLSQDERETIGTTLARITAILQGNRTAADADLELIPD